MKTLFRTIGERLRGMHGDDRGTISVITVFILLMFTMLLVMVSNSATHLDDKLKMQNAADAAAHSGGVMISRGMNGIAFTNHLLCDVFAVTAFLREGKERAAEKLTPQILQEWEQVAGKLERAQFEKFRRLGGALREKIPMERELIAAYSEMTEAAADQVLEVFEQVLLEESIPEFQRTFVRSLPELAQRTAFEVAYRHGLNRNELDQLAGGTRPAEDANGRGTLGAVMWRTPVLPVGGEIEDDPNRRTLPAVDPAPTGDDANQLDDATAMMELATRQRRQMAKFYLERWNSDKLRVFDQYAELSQFSNIWRVFSAGRLEELLAEYPQSNMPMLVRDFLDARPHKEMPADWTFENRILERDFQFVVVAYRQHATEIGPKIFRNPLKQGGDAMAFAQVQVFLPRARYWRGRVGTPTRDEHLGGTFGFAGALPVAPDNNTGGGTNFVWSRENYPAHWDMLNQNWMAQLMPARAATLREILSQQPPSPLENFRPPNLRELTDADIDLINGH